LNLARTRVVIFDLDGTLIDSAHDIATAVNAMLRHLAPHKEPLPLDRIVSFVGNGARLLLERAFAAAEIEAASEEQLPFFTECYKAHLLDETRLYPHIKDVLRQLAPRTLAVLSNKPGPLCREVLAGLGVADRFARIWGGGDVPQHKPDPEGLRRLIAELGATPAESVMVGDSDIDVHTGRAAGVATVGVTYGFDATSARAVGPDFLIDDPRELIHLLDSPEAA
jgi:phosphoglycolate phosphatase